MSDLHLCNCMYEHALVPKGRWVQWCVTHYSALYEFDGAAPTMCDERRSGAAGFCRWHPKGAFIPEVEEADDE